MRTARCGSPNICVNTWRKRPIALSNVPLPQIAVPDVNSTRPRGGDHAVGQFSLHDWMLNTIRVGHFCTFFAGQAEAMQPLLLVVCPLCKIEEIANQESESSSLPHAESVSLQCSSVSDYCDHIIRCHLSLLGIPRARFAKVAQFCCANNAPMARPFAVGNARRIEKHVPRRGSEGRKTQGWNLCSPKSVTESQKRADAWERIRRSDDGNGLSKYRKCGDCSERTRGNQSVDSLAHRLERIELLNDHRDELLLQRAQSTVVHSWWRETWPHSNHSQQPRRRERHTEGAPDGTTLHVGVCRVRQWPSQFRKQLISASDVDRILEMWNMRETHPKGRPVRTLVRYRMRTPDPALREHQQACTHPPQSLPPSKGNRTGRPGTTDEQRVKDTEPTRASTQEDGGKVHLMENEIDIHETDLAESMAIWDFGEDEHMFFQ